MTIREIFSKNTCISSKFLLKILLKVLTYNLMSRTIFKNSPKNTFFSCSAHKLKLLVTFISLIKMKWSKVTLEYTNVENQFQIFVFKKKDFKRIFRVD